ncbi:T9SS type A sorting domain-containing protein [uncultured Winogradskyella sp.]|uniref:T9SS type A sorting domain-containing protein n=1 Tax=uncultured Winogradskyella sp. TaxID=395353 RepID=UPI00262F8F18|nr:T9SS type A sorting domain-containing protein [uncultured Winogradskyella sp.]
MKKNTLKIALLFLLSIVVNQTFSQTAACDGTLPFEEQNGLLTIEMESGDLPAGSNWQTASEADPNLAGSTINYIFWDGPQSFNALSGAPITYNIKINNPGTYRLAWRGRIGTGTSGGEHNDAWLRIVADDFYATNQNNAMATPQLEPRPSCSTNTDRGCPAGSSTGGFFKAFMNRHPVNLPVEERWGFVTNTNDGSSFRFIWATFNAPGNYSVIVDARSNFFFMDKMVLRRTDVSDGTAFNLNNPESACASTLFINDVDRPKTKMYPNPTKGRIEISNLPINSSLTIFSHTGAILKEIHTTKTSEIIDISDLESGIYFISNAHKTNHFVKKIIKL